MPLPHWLARFNRRFTNRFFMLFAGRVPPWVIVRHRGRTSGRLYEVPLASFRVDGGFVFALTYGSSADWVRNIQAAGCCDVTPTAEITTCRVDQTHPVCRAVAGVVLFLADEGTDYLTGSIIDVNGASYLRS